MMAPTAYRVAAALIALTLSHVGPITRALADAPIPRYGYRIVNSFPHDPNAFTQGLVFERGQLYEGTGLYGRSTLRRVALQTGTVLQSQRLPPQLFGEGVTIFGDRILQLTWRAGIGLLYDRVSFKPLGLFRYPTEGWGLTHDDRRLILSDGTATLYLLDPTTLKETGRLTVKDDRGPVTRLNELEYVEGEILANVWQTDHIARISPRTGKVTGWVDLSGLRGSEADAESAGVLNGIAYDAQNKRLFVTGKLWPRLFEIELVPLPARTQPPPEEG